MSMNDIRAADKAAQRLNNAFPPASSSFLIKEHKAKQTLDNGKETMWAKVQRQRKEGHPKFKGGRHVEVPREIQSPFAIIGGYGQNQFSLRRKKDEEENVESRSRDED